jgi:hypothetical protein
MRSELFIKVNNDFRSCTHEGKIKISPDGKRFSLASMELLTDETGRSTPLSTGGEEITRFIWAKKQIQIDDIRIKWARIFFYVYEYTNNTSPLYIDINGNSLILANGDKNTAGKYFWRSLDIPVNFLIQGANEFIFHSNNTAFNAWILSLEGGYQPAHSAKSVNAGRSWRNDIMGYEDAIAGEYLVRLLVGKFVSNAEIISPVINLHENKTGIDGRYHLKALSINIKSKVPKGTSIDVRFRMGKKPFEFGEWIPGQGIGNGSKLINLQKYIQWKATLKTSNPFNSPEVKKVTIEVQRTPTALESGNIRIKQRDDVKLTFSSYPFSYQKYNEPKLAILRKQENLDEIIKGTSSEFEKFIKLREWVAQQWSYKSGNHYPPWDALVILDWLRRTRTDAGGGCMHYSVVFCQCCLSLGFVARLVIVEPKDNYIGDGHFMCEVWSNDFRKWILMDATTNGHFEANGIPLNLLEVRSMWEIGQLDNIQLVSGPARASSILGEHYLIEHLKRGGYRYAGLVLRNDHLSSLSPWEPDHGWVPYKWTGFLWWGRDVLTERRPFPLYTDRWEDFYWPINQIQFDLIQTAHKGELQVLIRSIAPNIDNYEISRDNGDWEPAESEFKWQLKPNDNLLKARVKNKFGYFGPTSKLTAVFIPID